MDLDSISDSEWTYLQAFLEGSQATDLEKAQLHYLFSLKAESCGDSIQQFEQIKMMNYLKRQTFVFDIKKSEDEMQEIINRFDSKFFAERSHFGRGGISPIFIVGMPRSGSTIVEQSLSVHSCVRGCGELRHIADLVQALSYVKSDPVANLIDHVASMTKTQSMGFAETYLQRVGYQEFEELTLTDKMPNNFRYLGFIALLFPDAKVIHCVKNPMDACFSCYRRYFNHGQNFSYDLSELVRYYKAYSNLMAHWEKVLPLDIHTLSYEALVRDQRGTLQELMAFCELDWEDSCLEFHKSTRVIHTASRYQVRQPLYQSAIDAWTVFEKELKPLQEMLGELPEISVSV